MPSRYTASTGTLVWKAMLARIAAFCAASYPPMSAVGSASAYPSAVAAARASPRLAAVVSIQSRMELVVPLTTPRIRSTRSPARLSRSGRMIGMAPPTPASYESCAPTCSAAANSSGPCWASSALFPVTTSAPDAIAASTSERAGSIPPMSSMTMSERRMRSRASVVKSSVGSSASREAVTSRTAMPTSSIRAPMRCASSSPCSSRRRATCDPTDPQPSNPTRSERYSIMRGLPGLGGQVCVTGVEITVCFAPDHESRRARAHGNNSRTQKVVVVRSERPAVSPGRGDRDEVTGRDIARQVVSIDDNVAGLAVRTNNPHECGHGGGDARGKTQTVASTVQRGAHIVTHATINGHVVAGSAGNRDRLHRANGVERHTGRPDDPAARFKRQSGHECAVGGTGSRNSAHNPLHSVGDGCRVILGRIRNPKPTTQVEFGQRRGRGERRVRPNKPFRRDGKTPGVKNLRPGVAVQTEQFQRGVIPDPLPQLHRSLQRHTEFLVLVGRREKLVGGCVYAAVNPQPHRLSAPHRRRSLGDPIDLYLAVEHNDADTGAHGIPDLPDGLVVSVVTKPSSRRTRGQRESELARRAHVNVEPLGQHPRHDRPGEQGLARVVHGHGGADTRGRGGENITQGTGAGAGLPLVNHVERSAVVAGKGHDIHTTDHEVTVGGSGHARRPDGRRQRVGIRRDGQQRRKGNRVGQRRIHRTAILPRVWDASALPRPPGDQVLRVTDQRPCEESAHDRRTGRSRVHSYIRSGADTPSNSRALRIT